MLDVTNKTFEQEVLNSDVPVIVDFWAAWCGPCRALAPVLTSLSEDYAEDVKIVKVNVDTEPNLAQEYRITSIPALIMFKDGQPVKGHLGAAPKSQIKDAFKEFLPS